MSVDKKSGNAQQLGQTVQGNKAIIPTQYFYNSNFQRDNVAEYNKLVSKEIKSNTTIGNHLKTNKYKSQEEKDPQINIPNKAFFNHITKHESNSPLKENISITESGGTTPEEAKLCNEKGLIEDSNEETLIKNLQRTPHIKTSKGIAENITTEKKTCYINEDTSQSVITPVIPISSKYKHSTKAILNGNIITTRSSFDIMLKFYFFKEIISNVLKAFPEEGNISASTELTCMVIADTDNTPNRLKQIINKNINYEIKNVDNSLRCDTYKTGKYLVSDSMLKYYFFKEIISNVLKAFPEEGNISATTNITGNGPTQKQCTTKNQYKKSKKTIQYDTKMIDNSLRCDRYKSGKSSVSDNITLSKIQAIKKDEAKGKSKTTSFTETPVYLKYYFLLEILSNVFKAFPSNNLLKDDTNKPEKVIHNTDSFELNRFSIAQSFSCSQRFGSRKLKQNIRRHSIHKTVYKVCNNHTSIKYVRLIRHWHHGNINRTSHCQRDCCKWYYYTIIKKMIPQEVISAMTPNNNINMKCQDLTIEQIISMIQYDLVSEIPIQYNGYLFVTMLMYDSAKFTWRFNKVAEHNKTYCTKVMIQDVSYKEIFWVQVVPPDTCELTIPFQLTPGKTYTATLILCETVHTTFGIQYHPVETYSNSFRSEYTDLEFQELYRRAFNFTEYITSNTFKPCHYIYRNKSPVYFNKIFNENDGIMTVRIKTLNGSPQNHINGEMKGLFFTARSIPHSSSVFGSRRLFIQTDYLINEQMCVYFEDFYCNKSNHKVTLVVTETGSILDNYYKEKMIMLNMFNNPFLKMTQYGLYVSNNINVEIFIAVDINIKEAMMKGVAFFKDVQAVSEKTPYPYYKNKHCKICNIYL